LVIRPTCGLIVWTAWTSSPSAHALRNFLVDLLPCRFHPLWTLASWVVVRVRSSPSPSFCWYTLETDTSFTCSLCASAHFVCKHSRITACSKKIRSFMCDNHFTCAMLQYRTSYSRVLPCFIVLALRYLLRCTWELHLGGGVPKLAVINSISSVILKLQFWATCCRAMRGIVLLNIAHPYRVIICCEWCACARAVHNRFF